MYKENMEVFHDLLSPSLVLEVNQKIFKGVIEQNSEFCNIGQPVIDFII
jgi:hypothetical protein